MISTSNLTKYYDTHAAVLGANLFVGAGDVCALIGPNGAGKTTLLKMLAGLLRPLSGRIEVAGVEIGAFPKRLHEIIGYVPDTFGLYDELTVAEFMDYFARAHNVPRAAIEKRVSSTLHLTGLTEKINAPTGALSRGMRQRLVIAKTLLHAPKVLLLDEPASGLDPRARMELRDLIKHLAASGVTLVVSSHILTELADFSTSVVIMEQGRIVRSGRISELVAELSGGAAPVRIEATDGESASVIAAWLGERESIRSVKVADTIVDFAFAGERAELAQLHKDLVVGTNGVVSFYERRLTVEDVFLATGSNRVA